MSTQTGECLIHNRNIYALCGEPLRAYIDQGYLPRRFSKPNSAQGWGYFGAWTIEADRLYLSAIKGQRAGPNGLECVMLSDLFPGYPDGVFAHWFSGELRCTYGMRIVKSGDNFSRLHSHDMFLQVQRGVVISERHVELGSPPARTQAETDQLMHALSTWTD